MSRPGTPTKNSTIHERGSSTSNSSATLSDGPQKRVNLDVIAESFSTFDHQSEIVDPHKEEGNRDQEFQQKMVKKTIDVMLNFYAWSDARPMAEHDRQTDRLERGINTIIDAEKRQGTSPPPPPPLPPATLLEMTRQRLNEFVARVRMALAALTGMEAMAP